MWIYWTLHSGLVLANAVKVSVSPWATAFLYLVEQAASSQTLTIGWAELRVLRDHTPPH